MKFEKFNLLKPLNKALGEEGFYKTTDIQFKAIPNILKGEDLLAIAQTGTGKTAAFAIPLLERIHNYNIKTQKKDHGIKAIIMVPTRELAKQVGSAFTKLGKYTNVKTLAVYGGVDQKPQIQQLLKRVDVIVATPGRMFDLSSQGYIQLNQVKTVVLDEADHMLSLGFIKDIRDLMKLVPKHRQTLFFSATIDKEIKKIAYSLINSANPIRIQIDPTDLITKNVKHYLVKSTLDEKRFFLEYLINQHTKEKFIVFVRTKVRAERVLKAMERVGIESIAIHGSKEQKERSVGLNRFKKGEISVLIATDVAARGIDIPNVSYVINYDLPEESENYVHRIGRTGRGNQKGTAISFYDQETEKDYLIAIEELIGKKITQLELDVFERKDILAETGEKKSSDNDWQSVLDIINEEKAEHKQKKKKRKNRR